MSTEHDTASGDELRVVPGGAPLPESEENRSDEDGVRARKVAEARLKIMNAYYLREDVRRELAERLILALGS